MVSVSARWKGRGNNILSFDLSGQPVSTQVLDVTNVALRELRGFVVLPQGDLLIAHAHKGEGKVLHFGSATGPTIARPYLGCFTTFDSVAEQNCCILSLIHDAPTSEVRIEATQPHPY